MKGPRVYYRFAWGNREIPKGELLFLLGTGKLNSVRVKAVHELKKEWITDRRALRKVGHECHCPTCPEYCMEDCVCGGICTCYYSMPKTVTKASRPVVTTGRKAGSGNREE